MLDPHTFGAHFEVGDHLAVEFGMNFSTQRDLVAQEAKDISAAETQQGVLHQARIQCRQTLGIPEHNVGGIFALATGPVIFQIQRAADFSVQGMVLVQEPV